MVYRIDIPQGNYLIADDVKKLRINMTKEQVKFVLGTPVVKDSFNDETWLYFYMMRSGRGGEPFRKELKIFFKDNRVTKVTGDFELSEDFNTPLDN